MCESCNLLSLTHSKRPFVCEEDWAKNESNLSKLLDALIKQAPDLGRLIIAQWPAARGRRVLATSNEAIPLIREFGEICAPL
jgi:hypothetical protein